jgi:hypothetical protein
MFFGFSQAPQSTRNEWPLIEHAALNTWALMMMPLCITLETALVAGLDHSDNQWKSLFARPVPRWTIYVAKLGVVVAMIAASTAILLCGIVLDGAMLPWLRSDLHFGVPVPWGAFLRDCGLVAGLEFLPLTIQHLVSLRSRSFSIAVGFGILATICGGLAFAMTQQFGGWPQYFPWAIPMLPLGRQAHDLGAVLWICAGAGLSVSAVGCWDFSRREVS